jgi:methylthioribose-1-phosphate isomerase
MMSASQSPLFEPVLWHGRGFQILDEAQVPDKIEYLEVTEVGQAIEAVRAMKTRAFGQVLTFLYSGALIAQSYSGPDCSPLRRSLAQMTEEFCATRPTFDFRGLGSFFDGWCEKVPSGADAGETIALWARECAQKIVRARQARAKRAAILLPNPASVLTHCNVSGELVAVARYCLELGKEFRVMATETRPYLQGARLTAWELAQAGVAVSLIPDCAIAQVMAAAEVNAVVVGADRTARNGDVINKVGTYPIARLAQEYGVPFHALVQDPRSLERGADLTIEERPAHELLTFRGQPLIAGDQTTLSARYPAFDVTPAALITYLIGFDDVYTPDDFKRKFHGVVSAGTHNSQASGKYILLYGVPPKSQYSFVMSALKAEGAESVLVPEMRPQLWGAQVVARELLERNAPATLISDNMMGTLFARGEIRKLCLFYRSLDEIGPVGICGSLLAVQLARLHSVPVELFQGDDTAFSTPDRDVSTFMGRDIRATGVTVRPVETEPIPWSLLEDESDGAA